MNRKQKALLKAIGQKVKELRREQKMTQAQLAFEAGMEIRQIQRLERGEANIGLANLYAVCVVLELKLSELFAAF